MSSWANHVVQSNSHSRDLSKVTRHRSLKRFTSQKSKKVYALVFPPRSWCLFALIFVLAAIWITHLERRVSQMSSVNFNYYQNILSQLQPLMTCSMQRTFQGLETFFPLVAFFLHSGFWLFRVLLESTVWCGDLVRILGGGELKATD